MKVIVKFENPEYDFTVHVGRFITKKQIKSHYVGKKFDVAKDEWIHGNKAVNMQECVAVEIS